MHVGLTPLVGIGAKIAVDAGVGKGIHVGSGVRVGAKVGWGCYLSIRSCPDVRIRFCRASGEHGT